MLCHHVEQIHQRVQIVAIIQYRFLHRLTHSLAGCEVYDALDPRMLCKQIFNYSHIGAVTLYEIGTYSGNTLYAVKHIDIGI